MHFPSNHTHSLLSIIHSLFNMYYSNNLYQTNLHFSIIIFKDDTVTHYRDLTPIYFIYLTFDGVAASHNAESVDNFIDIFYFSFRLGTGPISEI